MGKANIEKMRAHFTKLIEDREYREKFAVSIEPEGPRVIGPRADLILADAKRHLADLEKKHPSTPKPKEAETAKNKK